MKKLIFILLGFLILILALGALAIWKAPDLSNPETMQTLLSKLQPAAENQNQQWQEFTNSDGQFKIEYPSYWLAIKDENLLQAMTPQEWTDKYGLRTLLSAQNFQGGKFSQLIVYGGVFEIPIEEIFKKMMETNQNNGWTVEVVELDAGENEGFFEGKYKNPAGAYMHSKEKILISGKDAYWIALFTLEKDWQELTSTIDKILNSATIIK